MNDELEFRSRRRRIVLLLMASAFLVWQVPGMDFFNAIVAGDRRLAGIVSVGGFLVWALGLVTLLATGKGYARIVRPEVRAALEDELVRSNRSRAFTVGYIVALVSAALLFGISLFLPVSGTDAAHLIMVVAVVAPIYAFVILEHINA
jgi:hypothetical protein